MSGRTRRGAAAALGLAALPRLVAADEHVLLALSGTQQVVA